MKRGRGPIIAQFVFAGDVVRKGITAVCLALLATATFGTDEGRDSHAVSISPPSDLLDGIEVRYDWNAGLRWYRPEFDLWRQFDLRIHAVVGLSDTGRKTLALNVIRKDAPRLAPESLDFEIDGAPFRLVLADNSTYDLYRSGCRSTGTLFIANQESLARRIAQANVVAVTPVGWGRRGRSVLDQRDLEGFRRMLALYDRPDLPTEKYPRKEILGGQLLGPGMEGVVGPKIISKVMPRYPPLGQSKKMLARVLLQAHILKDGTVGEVDVIVPAGGDCGFEGSAIEAVKQWRYSPATRNGQPVDVYFTIVVDFVFKGYRLAPG